MAASSSTSSSEPAAGTWRRSPGGTSRSADVGRFGFRLALFLLLAVGMDQLLGAALGYLHRRTTEGSFGGQVHYALAQRNAVVIFGSSRAVYHYIPDLLEEALGESVFNAGMVAQSMLYHYGLERMLLDQYRPRAVLLDLNVMDIDPRNRETAQARLSILRAFRGHPAVAAIFDEISLFERLKAVSRSYPYNSMLLQLVKFTLQPRADGIHETRGYVPLHGSQIEREVDARRGATPTATQDGGGVEPDLGYVRRFIDAARRRDVAVVVVAGPLWDGDGFGHDSRQRALLISYRELLTEMRVPLIEIGRGTHPRFEDPRLFHDVLHLNDRGARIFCRLLAEGLRPVLGGSP